MPGARVRVSHQGQPLEAPAYADGNGQVELRGTPLPPTLFLEWAPADVPLEPGYPYRKRYYVELPDGDRREATRRRLANLGYDRETTLEGNVWAYQRAYQRPETGRWEDEEERVRRDHDHAALQPRPTMAREPSAFMLVNYDDPPATGSQGGGASGVASAGPTNSAPQKLDFSAAIKKFKLLVADDAVVTNGQFAWRNLLAEKIFKRAKEIMDKDVVLFERRDLITMETETMRTQVEFLIKKATEGDIENPSDFESQRVKVRDALRENQKDHPAAGELLAMLDGGESGAKRIYNSVSDEYAKGSEARCYRKHFGKKEHLQMKTLFFMWKVSKAGCFSFVEKTSTRIHIRGGLNGEKSTAIKPFNSDIFESGIRLLAGKTMDQIKAIHGRSLGDLVMYKDLSNGIVPRLIDAFEAGRGQLVRAGVVSGLIAENAFNVCDHWVLLIAHETAVVDGGGSLDKFAFWDPDSDVTKTIEKAFGIVYSTKGDETITKENYPNDDSTFPLFAKNTYKSNGKLTTALSNSELICMDGYGGFSQNLKDHERKLYQVTVLHFLGKLTKGVLPPPCEPKKKN